MAKVLELKQADAVRILKEACGFKKAGDWACARLKKKLISQVDENTQSGDEKLDDIIDSLIEAGENFEVVGEIDTKEEKTSKKDKKNKKEEAGKKDKKDKKDKDKPKRPGVIAKIIEILENGKPITKVQIASKLAKAFPDREEGGMLKTVRIQVPSRLKSDKGLKIKSDGEGRYWIEKK